MKKKKMTKKLELKKETLLSLVRGGSTTDACSGICTAYSCRQYCPNEPDTFTCGC